jgi:hypothetical protein
MGLDEGWGVVAGDRRSLGVKGWEGKAGNILKQCLVKLRVGITT